MKNSFLLLCLVCFSFLSIAQEFVPQETSAVPSMAVRSLIQPKLLPEAKDWGVTVNVNGLIQNISLQPRQDLLNNSTALIRYVKDEKWTIRFGLAPHLYRYSVSTTDSVSKDLVGFDSTASRSIMGFRPGVEYHFRGSNRLDPYVALDADFGVVGGLTIGSVTNVTDTTGTSRLSRTITEDGGFSIGAKLSAGMSFFLTKGLFVGMEYGLGIQNVVSGGDRQEVVQFEPISGANTTTRNLSSQRVNDLNVFVDPIAMITIGYFFSPR